MSAETQYDKKKPASGFISFCSGNLPPMGRFQSATEPVAAKVADGFVDNLVIEADSLGVGVEVGGHVGGDTHPAGHGKGVDVGAQENKFPAVFFPLLLHHLLYLRIGVFPAGIFHAVGDDGKQHPGRGMASRTLWAALMAANGRAHGVQQGGGAAPNCSSVR